MPRVYVGGTFDLLHYGHVRFLERCAEHGQVWVALNDDEFAASYKRKPILSLPERMQAIDGCKWVHRVIVNYGGADSKPAIRFVQPQYIAHGNDWAIPSLEKQMGISPGFMAGIGAEWLTIPYTSSISSSEIIARCRASQP